MKGWHPWVLSKQFLLETESTVKIVIIKSKCIFICQKKKETIILKTKTMKVNDGGGNDDGDKNFDI